SEKLTNALPTNKRLRHYVLSLNRSIELEPPDSSLCPEPREFGAPRRSRRLSRRPQSIATVGTGVEPPCFHDSARRAESLTYAGRPLVITVIWAKDGRNHRFPLSTSVTSLT